MVFQNHIYNFASTANDHDLYNCTSTSCNAQIKINRGNKLTFVKPQHKCKSNRKKVRTQLLRDMIKTYVIENPFANNEEIFNACIDECTKKNHLTPDDVKKINMKDEKSKNIIFINEFILKRKKVSIIYYKYF